MIRNRPSEITSLGHHHTPSTWTLLSMGSQWTPWVQHANKMKTQWNEHQDWVEGKCEIDHAKDAWKTSFELLQGMEGCETDHVKKVWKRDGSSWAWMRDGQDRSHSIDGNLTWWKPKILENRVILKKPGVSATTIKRKVLEAEGMYVYIYIYYISIYICI